ncbi:periodic tryptophan protein 2 [Nymphaea colorata]|nr:periodic tryptophan protein 2 [Nymphaea colorata]
MNFRFQNLLGAPYRGGNAVISENTTLLSPVGNRVSVTDLAKSQSWTLPCESSKNVSRIAVSPDGNFLLTVDENSRGLFINLRRRVILHRITFKHPVTALKFSPNGDMIAVAVGKLIQIWRCPAFRTEVFPFQLIRTISAFDGDVVAVDWSSDSQWILAGSKDLTARLCCLRKGLVPRPFLFLGHRDVVVGVFFGGSGSRAYTISKDGAVFTWNFEISEEFNTISNENNGDFHRKRKSGDAADEGVKVLAGDESLNGMTESPEPGPSPTDVETQEEKHSAEESGERKEDLFPFHKGQWKLAKKDYCMQAPAKVSTCDYHRGLDLVVIGFSSGVFGLYQMPDFVCIHLLSISRRKITTASFNDQGNWLVFGCAKLGQLLVWEWRSETYILKQQGHYFDVNCLAYSPDSQLLASGADDNKIKVWTVSSGFCFVTFSEHTNAVTALHFTANNNCLLSASLDGTVRAWDLFRYRNFRTFTSPSSRQFVSLASDQSGEVICAGTLDSFEIFVWSMKTGRLLDVLSGHEGPVHGLMFSPINAILASSSWDKTVRLWDVFEGKGSVETFVHTHDVLTVVYRPDGKQLASSTLDGQIYFWDPIDCQLMCTIEGRRDIAGGRLMTDRRTASSSSSGKYFTSLCYSADGNYILAGGNSKYICMYDITDQVLLRRFQTTHNLSLDGILDLLNSKKMTDAGALDLIDDEDSDVEVGVDQQTRGKLGYGLPGSLPNQGRPVIKTKCLRIAPTGRSWAAATTEGVLLYSIDESFVFDPTDLDIDITPSAAEEALKARQNLRALVISVRLNEDTLIKKCILAVDPSDVSAIAASIPFKYIQRLLEAIAELLENSPHLEFLLRWCQELCKAHGNSIQQNSRTLLPSLRSLQKAITRLHQDLADMCSSNGYLLQYLCSTRSVK